MHMYMEKNNKNTVKNFSNRFNQKLAVTINYKVIISCNIDNTITVSYFSVKT